MGRAQANNVFICLLHFERKDAIGAAWSPSSLWTVPRSTNVTRGFSFVKATITASRAWRCGGPEGTWRQRELPYRHAVAVAELLA